jgi:phage shock protein C
MSRIHNDSSEPRGFYRARDGAIFGVCKGLSRHWDISLFWIRAIFILLTLLTGLWPMVIAYVVMALLMKPEPMLPLETDDDREFYNSYTTSREMALRRLKQTYDRLDRRIRQMEDIVTARDYDWESRLHEK